MCFEEVDIQDEIVALIYVDDCYAVSPCGGAVEYLQNLLSKHGFDLEAKPVVNDGKTKTFFLGLEVTQSEDRFEVSLGMEGFTSRFVQHIVEKHELRSMCFVQLRSM